MARPRRSTRRRPFLRTVVAAGHLALAGCLNGRDGQEPEPSSGDGDPETDPLPFPEIEDPPDAVYLPTHREEMRTLDPVFAGEYGLTPMLTYPHPFWTVAGSVERTDPTAEEDVHLMVTVWDRETETVVPIGAGTSLEVRTDGDLVDRRNLWVMLSQQMGLHVGDNLPLDGDGTYRVEGRIGSPSVRTTGAFANRFDAPAEFAFEFTFDDDLRAMAAEVDYFDEDRWGEPGALEPMGHGVPYSALAPADDLPGTLLGAPARDGVVFATTLLESGSRFVDGGDRYLAISPRTPYNRCVLPGMALEATVGDRRIDLVETLDDELGYHYGGPLPDGAADDEVTVDVLTPPQVARHRGYERAFLETPTVTLEVTQ